MFHIAPRIIYICSYTIVMFQNVELIAKNITYSIHTVCSISPMSYLLSIASKRLQVHSYLLVIY